MASKKQTSKKTTYSLEELDKALREVETYMESAMLPFMVLGETLKTIMDKGQVDGEKIEVGIKKKYLTKEVLSLFKTWGFDMSDGMVKYKVGNVPVEMKIIRKEYKFFDKPDTKFYKITQYSIPNPWTAYWNVKGLIR